MRNKTKITLTKEKREDMISSISALKITIS